MPFLICFLVSVISLFPSIQESEAQTRFTCRQVVFSCNCGNPGYVFQAAFNQCHYWLPREEACTKFQHCLECETGVDRCISCPPNRYGRRCTGVCQCKDGQTCNRDTGQCEGKGGPIAVSCTPPHVEPPVEQKEENDRGILKAIEYSCPFPYILNGAKRITCNDGKWDNDPPRCRASGCSRPNDIDNGRIEHFTLPSGTRIGGQGSGSEQVFPVATIAVYKCNSYYKLGGKEVKLCLNTGKWDGELRCLVDCGISEFSKEPNIINGIVTKPGYWPWQAALANLTNYIFCGGSLITESWVLTAAHCRYDKGRERSTSEINIFLGKYSRSSYDENVQQRLVRRFIEHENYNSITYDSDIALVELSEPIQITSRTLPVCLTKRYISHLNVEVGKSGLVTGWGKTETGEVSDVLKRTKLTIISSSDCEERYLRGTQKRYIITENMFCAGVPHGASDVCYGDSGGPMVFEDKRGEPRWIQEGIVSWGSSESCATDGLYSGFTKVEKFLFWIYRHVPDLQ